MKITNIFAQELLDSRGNPTVCATVEVDKTYLGTALVPSGASTGTHEALELRDADAQRYNGKGVLKAVDHVTQTIAPKLKNKTADQVSVDRILLELDGTPKKKRLGANAILAVSMATARAAAAASDLPLYAYLGKIYGHKASHKYLLPIPMMNVLNGGRHARGSTDMQEYMIIPVSPTSFAECVRYGAEVFHALQSSLAEKGLPTTVGDEGGFAPPLLKNEEPLEWLVDATTSAGYKPGEDVAIGLDPAASEFYVHGKYDLKSEGHRLSADDMVKLYKRWVAKYPIKTIEDGLSEDDWEGFSFLTQAIGDTTQIVGDDLFVTDIARLKKGLECKAANAILIKLNQIGTVTETMETIRLAQENHWQAVVSHRSGETEDTFIADLVVATGTGQIKTGSLCRSERTAKYNRLMVIERELGDQATLARFPY